MVVEDVENNTLGLTEEDVERAVKLRLLANGIKEHERQYKSLLTCFCLRYFAERALRLMDGYFFGENLPGRMA